MYYINKYIYIKKKLLDFAFFLFFLFNILYAENDDEKFEQSKRTL